MRKIMVIGCPGSGKSTFSTALHKKTGLPLYHLDNMYWNADKTVVEKNLFGERLSTVLATDRWIIDGNFSATMEQRLALCDTVFFLDYPTDLCLEGVRARRGKTRTDIPWIETEEDAEFMAYIREFSATRRPAILELLEKYADRQVVVFHTRDEATAFLDSIQVE